ncbi:hypothetical protein D8W73_08890 [Citrobacter amalonaticus]|nr:hypothetical protein [Citrobacter amalonaticus]
MRKKLVRNYGLFLKYGGEGRLTRCARPLSNPGRGFSSPPMGNIKEKSRYISTGSHLKYGGEGGIDSLRSRYSAHPWASPLRGQRKRCSKTLLAFLCGRHGLRPFRPTGCARCRTPVVGSHPPHWGI